MLPSSETSKGRTVGLYAAILAGSAGCALFFLGLSLFFLLSEVMSMPAAALLVAACYLLISFFAWHMVTLHGRLLKHEAKQKAEMLIALIGPAQTVFALLRRSPLIGMGLGAVALMLLKKKDK